MKPSTFFLQRTLAAVLVALALLTVIVCSGCHTTPKPQKGGRATIGWNQPESQKPQGYVGGEAGNEYLPQGATLTQPENPNASSEQTSTYEKKTETMLPAPAVKTVETKFPDGRVITVTETKPAGTVLTESVKQGIEQKLSGSWKDTARELGVKLTAARPIQFFGIGLMVFGAAGLFYAPLRVLLGGGKQFPIACIVIGVVLLAGMPVIAGNERLVIIITAVAGLLYWLSIRLTRHETIVDLNRNGIPDDKETTPPASP